MFLPLVITTCEFDEGWGNNPPTKMGNLTDSYYNKPPKYLEDGAFLPLGAALGSGVLNDPRFLLCTSHPLSPTQLARSDLRTPKEHWASTSEEDWCYLANLIGQALEDELSNLAYYTRHAFVILPIRDENHWDAFSSDQWCKEKREMEESICSLTLQRDTYLQEIHKSCVSLTRVSEALSAPNLPRSLVDQVDLLLRVVSRKD